MTALGRAFSRVTSFRGAGLAMLWVLMLIAFAFAVPNFYSLSNVTSILQFSTILALVTLGQALVIIGGGGGIDLSVGGNVSLSGLVLAALMTRGVPLPIAILACLTAGALLGAVNGFLVARIKILPLIVTLGTFYAYNGLALALTGGAPVRGVPRWFGWLGRTNVLDIPVHTLMVLVPATAIMIFALRELPFGGWVYAMGTNETAARLVGIPVSRLRFLFYVISGILCGLASIVGTSWLLSARPDIGTNLELQSLAASLLGGISIFGGYGSVGGAILGAYFLVTLQAGLQLANVNAIWQVGLVGFFLIFSVFLEQVTARR